MRQNAVGPARVRTLDERGITRNLRHLREENDERQAPRPALHEWLDGSEATVLHHPDQRRPRLHCGAPYGCLRDLDVLQFAVRLRRRWGGPGPCFDMKCLRTMSATLRDDDQRMGRPVIVPSAILAGVAERHKR